MNKFFVTKEIYKERLDLCRACVYYFKPTGTCKACGCFMKIKASIGSMECPQKFWNKTTEIKELEDLPETIIEEVLLIWDDIKNGRAKDVKTKRKSIELYNTIYNANHSLGTGCSSCLQEILDGIRKVYEKYK